MPTIEYDNVGEVLKHEFVRGEIQTVDSATDTCTVTVAGRLVTALIFYHCTPESVIRDNGAIEGAAGGFGEGDAVLVQTNRDDPTEYLVVAHLDGVRPCSLYVVEFIFIGATQYWLVSGDSYTLVTDSDKIEQIANMGYHLYAGEWLHENYHAVNWKPGLTYEEKKPEKSMEWVAGSGYSTPPPDGAIMPAYKLALLDAWEITTEWDTTPYVISGLSPQDSLLAALVSLDNSYSSVYSGSYGSSYCDFSWLKGSAGGGEVEWPPYQEGNCSYDQTYDGSYSYDGDAGAGTFRFRETKSESGNYGYSYYYLPCGDNKVWGCFKNETMISQVEESCDADTGNDSIEHYLSSSAYNLLELSPFVYGSHELRPAASSGYTSGGTLQANGSGAQFPASGGTNTTYFGTDYSPWLSIGVGDDEFVCLYEEIVYDGAFQSFTASIGQLNWSDATWGYYGNPPYRNLAPRYIGASAESHEVKNYWVAFRTIAGAAALADGGGDDLFVKDGIVHIKIACNDLNNNDYQSPWIVGCDCGDYFFVYIRVYILNPYPTGAGVFRSDFLAINKKTGNYFYTNISEDGSCYIYVKGIGSDIYKEPEPEA